MVPPPADLPAPGHLRRQRLDAQPLDAAEPGGPGRFRHHAVDRVHDPPGAAGHGRGHRRHQLPHAPAQGSAAGRSRRREEPASGGEDRRGAGQGRLEPAGEDVGLLGPPLGALQHLRLPRVAAPGRARRLLPQQPLHCARRLLLGQLERRDPQRRPLDVRRLLGARAPQGRGGRRRTPRNANCCWA